MYVYIYIYIYIYTHTHTTYVCVYIYIYIYTHTSIHTIRTLPPSYHLDVHLEHLLLQGAQFPIA